MKAIEIIIGFLPFFESPDALCLIFTCGDLNGLFHERIYGRINESIKKNTISHEFT